MLSFNNTFLMHREIQSMFSGDEGRRVVGDILFRIEEDIDKATIYIQSLSVPDPSKSQLFNTISETMSFIDMDEYYKDIKDGDTFKFVLNCRPTVQKRNNENGNSKKRVIYNPSKREKWLYGKGIKCGFELLNLFEKDSIKYNVDTAAALGSLSDSKNTKNKPKEFYIDGLSYVGSLKVKNVELLKQTLRKGIGPSKAHGFGLLILL